MTQQQLIGNEKASIFRGKLNDNFTELYGLTENKLIVQGFKDNYADLTTNCPAADHINEWWGVNNAQGNVLTFNRKPSGIYKSDGTTWKYQGISLDYLLVDNNFALSDNNDNTKKVQFELSGISTSTTRTLTIPNSNGVIALLNDLHDPVTVTDSSEIDFTLDGQDIKADIKTASIAKSKLDSSVQTSLGKADSAIQDISGKEDVSNKKTSLADNSDTFYPTQKAVKTAVDAKQDILSEGAFVDGDNTKLDNLSGVNTGDQDLSPYEEKSNKRSSFQANTDDTTILLKKLVKDSLDGKQETLVSGTNIKTINSESLLGSGNIVIEGDGGDVVGPASSANNNVAVFDGTTGKLIKDGGATLGSKQDALGFTPEDVANKRTSFQATPDNTAYPTEKLVKDSLDLKADSADLHDPLTVTDSSEIAFTLTNQDITASIKSGSIDYSKVANDLKSSTAISASDIDWSSAGVFTKTLTAATTFTFSNLQVNKVITIVLDGNYTITWPSYMDENHLISGEYDGTVKNYIQVHCTNATVGSEEVWWAIKTLGA